MTLLVLHAAICAAVWWSIFCRAAKSDRTIHRSVRSAFTLLSFAVFYAATAPFIDAREVLSSQIVLAASIGLLQMVTSRFWKHGTPPQFTNPRVESGRGKAHTRRS